MALDGAVGVLTEGDAIKREGCDGPKPAVLQGRREWGYEKTLISSAARVVLETPMIERSGRIWF